MYKKNVMVLAVLLLLASLTLTGCLIPQKFLPQKDRAAHYDRIDHIEPDYAKVLGEDVVGGTASSGNLLDVNMTTMTQQIYYNAWFIENEKRHLGEIADLVSYPTMSMFPNNAEDLVDAGKFLAKKLTAIGMNNVGLRSADGFPLVTAEWMGAAGQPTVLFYAHYDVPPADADRWDTNPFSAEVRAGRMYGRGTTDNKGAIIALISALEVQFALEGKLPVNVMLLLDGAGENGSQHLAKWLAEHQEWISRPDYGFTADAMMYSDDQGLMFKGHRGGGDVEVTLTSASTALHSGIYGGVAPNAAIAASKVIASMWSDDGTVAVKGFYADIDTANDKILQEIADVRVDEGAVRNRLGVAEWIGEKEHSVIERTLLRASLDVTGVKSGYIERKAPTIPHSAWFRVMSRTALGQDPAKLNRAIMSHIEKHVPWGVTVEMKESTFGAARYFAEEDLGFRIGKTVLTEALGQEPHIVYVGGGMPASTSVFEAGGPNLVTFGFQRSDEGSHADNEFMRISSFKKGQRAYARLIHAIVGQPERKR